jgi:hypothetical protein
VTPLEWLGVRLEVSRAELDALWLLACCELDPGVARLAQAFATSDCPDLAVLAWQQLIEIATGRGLEAAQIERLAELALIETTFDVRAPLQRRWVRVNDRVLELARGELRLDREVAKLASLAPASSPSTNVPSIAAALTARPVPLVVAAGSAGSGRATLLRGAGAGGTITLAVAELAGDPTVAGRQLRAFAREARLFNVTPLLCELDVERTDRATVIERELLRTFDGPMLATAASAPTWVESRPVVTHVMQPLSTDARVAVWSQALGAAEADVVTEVSSRYALVPGAIKAAAAGALARVGGDGTKVTVKDVHEGLRGHLGKQLGQLATRVDWRQTWDDLVLPPEQFEQIIELVARVRHRKQVMETWGFGVKIGKGQGVSALMSGPPGTGKTMVAGLIAAELGLDLYQVDLSRIVSKYIGETEKNLATLFDAAESGHAILLFDEADSLFAKRSEVKSSNDRYANLEVNYLLQRMEQFTGISLLTTNHETTIDEAFRRRLALHVRFPIPDLDQRAALWRALIPAEAAIAKDIDFARLAHEFEMSGGYIKNAVVRAAYLAADAGCAIGMAQLLKAAHAEYEAMGKVTFQLAA